jgi:hypothetical protein
MVSKEIDLSSVNKTNIGVYVIWEEKCHCIFSADQQQGGSAIVTRKVKTRLTWVVLQGFSGGRNAVVAS